MAFAFDHLAVCCEQLEDGITHVEAALGVTLSPGGKHPDFGTHNALLALGAGEYLEVIAIDPDAPSPRQPRWFDLDRFSGAPRLTNWVVRADDLGAACASAPEGIGTVHALSRGAYRWRMAVPDDGVLPLNGLHPALIAWDGPHPAEALPPSGCTLSALALQLPIEEAASALPNLHDPRISTALGPTSLTALINTPAGPRTLA